MDERLPSPEEGSLRVTIACSEADPPVIGGVRRGETLEERVGRLVRGDLTARRRRTVGANGPKDDRPHCSSGCEKQKAAHDSGEDEGKEK